MKRWIYRNLYMRSLGWKWTKALRKSDRCKKCKCITYPLHLHHLEYKWHNRHPLLTFFFPNLWDKMQTLCQYHHELAHKKG